MLERDLHDSPLVLPHSSYGSYLEISAVVLEGITFLHCYFIAPVLPSYSSLEIFLKSSYQILYVNWLLGLLLAPSMLT